MKFMLDWLERVMSLMGILGIVAITGIIGAQIVSRSLFNLPFTWPEEASQFLLIAVVFLGIPLIERNNQHIGVNFLFDRFPGIVQHGIRVLSKLGVIYLSVGLLMGESELWPRIINLRTRAARIPYRWIHGLIIACCILWIVYALVGVYRLTRSKEARQ